VTSTQPIRLERQPRHLVADEPPSLVELAATANQEHALCEEAEQAALGHAIRCGEALLQARSLITNGEWMRWLVFNFEGSQSSASNYMRIAAYQSEIPDGAGLKAAVRALSGLPAVSNAGVPSAHDANVRDAAVAAVRAGETLATVAERVGVTPPTVYGWANPDKLRQYRARATAKSRAAAKALAAAERDREIKRAVRKAGAALAEVYSMSARMAQVLAQAEQEAASTEARAALEEARAHYHKMSDAIVRALGVA
jgi:transposase